MPTISRAPLSGRYLSFEDREEIALLRARGCGVRETARRLGRSPATISRELRRNAATRGARLEYRASTAQWHADRRGRRPKPAKLASNARLRSYVQERLAGSVGRPDGAAVAGPTVRWIGRRHGPRKDRRWAKAWSPEQISNRLRVDFPDDGSMRISHEAIYQSLYVQGRGALRRELTACLRTGRALRVPRARSRRGKHFVTDEILISSLSAFELLFKEDDFLVQHIPGWVDSIAAHLPLNDQAHDVLLDHCRRNTRFRRRLETIHSRGHLQNVTLQQVCDEATEQGLDAATLVVNGKLNFGDASVDDLLRLLNEDLLIGGLSGDRFTVERKTPR